MMKSKYEQYLEMEKKEMDRVTVILYLFITIKEYRLILF